MDRVRPLPMLLAAAVLATLSYALSGQHAYSFWIDTALFNVPFVAAAAAALVKSHGAREQAPWHCLAGAMLAYVLGNCLHDLNASHAGILPWFAPELLYMTALALLYGALGTFIVGRVAGRSAGAVIDGLIVGTGMATLLYHSVYSPLLAAHGSTVKTIIHTIYPLADLGLVVMAATATLLLRGQMSRGWLALSGALVAFSASDTFYLAHQMHGTYHAGGALDSGYLVAACLFTATACTKWTRMRAPAGSEAVLLVPPLMLSLAVLMYLYWGSFHHIGAGAQSLGLICLLLSVVRVMLAMREASSASGLRHESRTDGGTGLANRRGFEHALAQAMRPGSKFALLLIDLDGFKQVNDNLGHPMGDLLLTCVAERIARTTPDSAMCARIGGDEFAVIVPQMAKAKYIAEVLHRRVSTPYELGDSNAYIGASIGVAYWPRDGNVSQLMRAADNSMYRRKEAGGGVEEHDPSRGEQMVHGVAPRELAEELRGLLTGGPMTEQNQFVLHYQPIIALSPGAQPAVEALVRWQRNGQTVPPDAFIPVAERSGLMQMITRHVLQTAIADIARLRRREGDFAVAVNLAASSLLDPTLVPTIKQLLADHQLPPEALKVEITESMIVTDPRCARRTVKALRELGIRVMVDDYGTGYASISHLQTFDLDALKLDRSLVERMMNDDKTAVIVRSTIEMAHALGLSVVGEGVETELQLRLLRQMDCDYAQGFLFGRPVSLTDLEAQMRSDAIWPVTDAGSGAA
jgi:diguanylate cyclase (GGDEF)-like protein